MGQLELGAVQRLARVSLHRALREGYGLAASEALWKTTPVIGGPDGGVPLQVRDGVDGYLTEGPEQTAERLVELAEGEPQGRPADLAGPEELRMTSMVKTYTAATGIHGPVVQIPLPGGFGKAMRDGTTIAGPDAQRGVQTFAQWIDGLSATH